LTTDQASSVQKLSTPRTTISAAPTPVPTPPPTISAAPTPVPTPPTTIGASNRDLPPRQLKVYVDWTKVDMIDAGIDGFGIAMNVIAIKFPQADNIGAVVEGIGFIKSAYELTQNDPSSMLIQQTTSQAERVSIMFWRAQRTLPFIGIVGNLVSLNRNLQPKIVIE
jgi:hypothetical protein